MKQTLLLMTGSALATAALFFASAPARSAQLSAAAVEAVKVVPTADLDLSSALGRKALDRRIGRAVIELCGQAADVDLAGRNAVRKCRADTLSQAHQARDQRLALRSTEPVLLAAR